MAKIKVTQASDKSGDQLSFERSLYQARTNAHAPLGLIALCAVVRRKKVISEHEPILVGLRANCPGLLNKWLELPL